MPKERQAQTLILGGAFDPIHHGHLICARAAAETCRAGRVILMVAGQSPGKSVMSADAAHRVAMCAAAVAGDPLFEVDARETRRPGPSYTIDTAVELLAEQYPPFSWLIGADQLMSLQLWKRYLELLETIPFLVMARPGFTIDFTLLDASIHALQESLVTVPLIDISSTQIRRRASEGKPLDYLTPPAVFRYIAEHRLYGAL